MEDTSLCMLKCFVDVQLAASTADEPLVHAGLAKYTKEMLTVACNIKQDITQRIEAGRLQDYDLENWWICHIIECLQKTVKVTCGSVVTTLRLHGAEAGRDLGWIKLYGIEECGDGMRPFVFDLDPEYSMGYGSFAGLSFKMSVMADVGDCSTDGGLKD